jgi:hypothetical protein
MQQQRISAEAPSDRFTDEHIDSIVLDFMLGKGSWPWTEGEIALELGHAADAADAIARLTGAGLVHRCNGLVFPTRTARRAYELQLGTV